MNWKDTVLKSDYKTDVFSIVKVDVEEDEGLLFHKSKKKGANLRELSDNKLHQSSWELPSYKKVIEKYLANVSREDIVMDVGCGDGRFTTFLLALGFKKIIAIDSDIVPLISLSNYIIEEDLTQNVLLLNSSVIDMPIKDNVVGAILSICVLYYLGDKQEKGLSILNQKLKSGGTLILTEHNYEAILLRALIFNGYDEFIKTLKTSKFKETDQITNNYFPVSKKHEWNKVYSKLNMTLIEENGISIFHQFLSISKSKQDISDEHLSKELPLILSFFNYIEEEGNIYKTYIRHIVKEK